MVLVKILNSFYYLHLLAYLPLLSLLHYADLINGYVFVSNFLVSTTFGLKLFYLICREDSFRSSQMK